MLFPAEQKLESPTVSRRGLSTLHAGQELSRGGPECRPRSRHEALGALPRATLRRQACARARRYAGQVSARAWDHHIIPYAWYAYIHTYMHTWAERRQAASSNGGHGPRRGLTPLAALAGSWRPMVHGACIAFEVLRATASRPSSFSVRADLDSARISNFDQFKLKAHDIVCSHVAPPSK